MIKKISIILLISILAAANLAAENDSSDKKVILSVFPTDIWAGKLSVEFTGFSLIEGQKTSLETELRGGWLTQESYYTGSFESPLSPSDIFDYTNAAFKTVFVQNTAGIRQGFIRNDRNGKNLIESFLYYKARWEGHTESDGNSPWFMALTDNPETESIFQNSIVAGAAYNDIFRNPHGIKDGFNGELKAEYAPSFMNTTADYYCFTGEVQAYLPILDLSPEKKNNTFSVYLADRVRGAYTEGSYRPYSIRLENAAEVRGIEKERLDSRFTAVNNLELRFNLPSIILSDVKPGILTYFDVGYYYENSSCNGTVLSTGAGLYLDLFVAFQGGLRYDYLLKGERMDKTVSSFNMMLTYYF